MYCPTGQRMERLSDARRVTNNGFVQTISRYKARNYKDCPLRCRCYRSRSERIVQVNHRLRKIKEREREKLLSDEGLVQNELFIGTELGIVSGFELSVLHMVIFHAHESSVIVCL